jgi:hypothetical protein
VGRVPAFVGDHLVYGRGGPGHNDAAYRHRHNKFDQSKA